MRLDRTLVIAPHPDDDVIGAGGLIQRVAAAGGELHVVFVTDGENNPWPQRWMHKRWSIGDADRKAWGAMRREEAVWSLTRLGVPAALTTFLAFPDSRIAACLRGGDLRLLQALRKIVADFEPTLIVSPSSRDLHSDHRAVAWSAHAAAGTDITIATYVIHGDTINPQRLACRLELTSEELSRKRAAIECHRSQLVLSRERFLSFARPTESFYNAEFDLIGVESSARERFARLRQNLGAMLGNRSRHA